MKLKILDTDKFFYDSPDAGDPDCICSRCGDQILENEVPTRIFVSNTDITTGEGETIEDCAHGSEFRLCERCTAQAL